MVVKVDAVMARAISRVPAAAALYNSDPLFRYRLMFSSTTMALSTSRPMPRVSPLSDTMLSCMPARYITKKVRKMLTGMAMPMVKGIRGSFRNRKSTIKASTPPMSRVCSRLLIVFLM